MRHPSFPLHLEDVKLFVHIWSVKVVTFSEMFLNSRVHVFSNELKLLSVLVSHKLHLKFANNTLLIH